MSLRPFFRLLKTGQLIPALAANTLFKSFYKLCYLSALESAGLMARLRSGPVPLESLVDARGDKAVEALHAWLQMGCTLGLLRLDDRGYVLRGLARTMAKPQNDGTLALTHEDAMWD